MVWHTFRSFETAPPLAECPGLPETPAVVCLPLSSLLVTPVALDITLSPWWTKSQSLCAVWSLLPPGPCVKAWSRPVVLLEGVDSFVGGSWSLRLCPWSGYWTLVPPAALLCPSFQHGEQFCSTAWSCVMLCFPEAQSNRPTSYGLKPGDLWAESNLSAVKLVRLRYLLVTETLVIDCITF